MSERYNPWKTIGENIAGAGEIVAYGAETVQKRTMPLVEQVKERAIRQVVTAVQRRVAKTQFLRLRMS